MGVDEITWATPNPLGDYLWGVYFETIFWNIEFFGISWTRVFFLNLKKYLKILKFFITLLRCDLHYFFAKTMSFKK